MPIQYVDSGGRVPRGAAEIANADLFRQALLIALCLREGGSVEVGGFGTPEAVNRLIYHYELKISGAGAGTFRLEAVEKP